MQMIRKRPLIHWACNGCNGKFDLDWNQFIRHRMAKSQGRLDGKKFFCRECREEGRATYKKDVFRDHGRFTLANMETYWKKVEDLTYYQGLRYSVATPLSYQDRSVRIARSTKART